MNRTLKACLITFICVVACQQINAQGLCDRVAEIRVLPFKGERVDDAAYNALIEAGESALPCLIAKVADTRLMRDPRQTFKYGGVTVGDVAYFVLVWIAKIDFVEMLPAKVQKSYKTEGVNAYFEFVEKIQNRKRLGRRLREWYQRRGGRAAHSGRSMTTACTRPRIAQHSSARVEGLFH
jgi:hypothetical protein